MAFHLPSSPAQSNKPASLVVIYDMDGLTCLQGCPPPPPLSCGINMRRDHDQGQLVPLASPPPRRVLFDFSILFPLLLLLCFGCCVLGCRVSPSLVRRFPCASKLLMQLGRGTFLFRDAAVQGPIHLPFKHLIRD